MEQCTRDLPVVSVYLEHLDRWISSLETLPIEQLVREAGGPENVAVFCVDMVNGFCKDGQLQSNRVSDIVPNVVRTLEGLHAAGIRSFVLTQDWHAPDAAEFRDFPVHCVRGTSEAHTIDELMSLPFSDTFQILHKESLSAAIGTGLDQWLTAHPSVTHRVVVGDCTDLCVYQMAMYLKLTANARNLSLPVIVPEDCVATYDFPIDVAEPLGIPAHPGDILHSIFLQHMALNGIQVVCSLT